MDRETLRRALAHPSGTNVWRSAAWSSEGAFMGLCRTASALGHLPWRHRVVIVHSE